MSSRLTVLMENLFYVIDHNQVDGTPVSYGKQVWKFLKRLLQHRKGFIGIFKF
jgi:hypothetical protein